MRVGIIAEGPSDAAVITNILKGRLGIDKSDIQYLVPELEFDETDLKQMRLEQFSNWEIVKKKCCEQTVFSGFLNSVDDKRFIVVHLDTAERLLKGYDAAEPKKEKHDQYSDKLREKVVSKINEWLNHNYSERTAYAIAIEETDAWVLTVFSTDKETGFHHNPKERLKKLLNEPNLFSEKEKRKIFSLEDNKYQQYLLLSTELSKNKKLSLFSQRNKSMKLFCESLEMFKFKNSKLFVTSKR